jgi:hypothetical protein
MRMADSPLYLQSSNLYRPPVTPSFSILNRWGLPFSPSFLGPFLKTYAVVIRCGSGGSTVCRKLRRPPADAGSDWFLGVKVLLPGTLGRGLDGVSGLERFDAPGQLGNVRSCVPAFRLRRAGKAGLELVPQAREFGQVAFMRERLSEPGLIVAELALGDGQVLLSTATTCSSIVRTVTGGLARNCRRSEKPWFTSIRRRFRTSRRRSGQASQPQSGCGYTRFSAKTRRTM